MRGPFARVYNVETLAEHLGVFEQAILLSLVRPRTELGRERYGRAILKEVEHRLEREVSPGARLRHARPSRTKSGSCRRTSRQAPRVRAGRPRRHYAIEASGLRALQDAKSAANRLWAGVRLPTKGNA